MLLIQVFGMLCGFTGLLLLIKPKECERFTDKFKAKSSYFAWAILCFLVGAFLVSYYHFTMWHDHKEMLVVIVGYLSLLKAVMFGFLPHYVSVVIDKTRSIPYLVVVKGVILLAVGVWFLFF